MELTYIIIAAVIIIFPFILTRLFSGRSRMDTDTVPGASTATRKNARQAGGKETPAAEVNDLLDQGSKIEAITSAREKTALPLATAKDMVETIEKSAKPATVEPAILEMIRVASELAPAVQQLVKEGKKVEAIKLIRDRTGMDLKEAKDIVDKLE